MALSVLLLAHGAENAFSRTATRVPILVAGEKGSRIDALLSTVFHTGATPGLVPMDYVKKLQRDPRVEWAIPVVLGDRVSGFPLVGTEPAMLNQLEVTGEPFGGKQAVAGAHTGLAIGDRFFPSHTGARGDKTHQGEWFTVSGLIAPTGTAHDRAVYIDLQEFLALKGHRRDIRGVSGVYVKPISNSPLVVEPLLRDIDQSADAQAIRPTQVVAELIALFGTAQRVLQLVAWLVIAVAGISVSVALYNAMAARVHEIAVLRALGARRSVVVGTVLTEAVLLCVGGGLLGLAFGHLGATLAGPAIERYAGASFEPGILLPAEPLLLLGLAVLGAVAGTLPARRAYRVDVASSL